MSSASCSYYCLVSRVFSKAMGCGSFLFQVGQISPLGRPGNEPRIHRVIQLVKISKGVGPRSGQDGKLW